MPEITRMWPLDAPKKRLIFCKTREKYIIRSYISRRLRTVIQDKAKNIKNCNEVNGVDSIDRLSPSILTSFTYYSKQISVFHSDCCYDALSSIRFCSQPQRLSKCTCLHSALSWSSGRHVVIVQWTNMRMQLPASCIAGLIH